MRFTFAFFALLVASSALAQQQPPTPANFDIRVSAAMRNDIAGLLIKMQQLGACDVPCHIIIARALIALESATPVEAPAPPPADKN